MLVTLADMKANLGIDSSDTSHDAFLTNQIALISETIEVYCRRKFLLGTYIQTFYSSDYQYSSSLDLFHYPVRSIISITEGTFPYSEYRLAGNVGILTRAHGSFFSSSEETVIEYTAGFTYSEIPLAIKDVVFSLVGERFSKKTSGVALNFGSDVQRVSIPGTISIDFDYSLSNNDRKTPFGTILGNHLNVLDFYRSARAIYGSGKIQYVG